MRIRNLREDDVPAAVGLSEQAGWNQIRADWRRLLRLNADTCFAGVVDGELVATSTLVTHDGVGWIGMVLVDEDHRRRGLGMRIFERALDAALENGITAVGLDATDAGRAVYQQRGFVDVGAVERWSGTLDVPGSYDGGHTVVRDPPLSAIRPIDRRACGHDRTPLLNSLAGDDGVETLLVSPDRSDDAEGYAVLRPGREYAQIGPIVASDGEVLAALLATAEELTGKTGVVVDVFRDPETKAVLRNAALTPERRLTRMAYEKSAPLLMGDDVVAAAGLELG